MAGRAGHLPTRGQYLEHNSIALLSDLAHLLEDAAYGETQRAARAEAPASSADSFDDYRDGASRTVADSRLHEFRQQLR